MSLGSMLRTIFEAFKRNAWTLEKNTPHFSLMAITLSSHQ